ncbi:MAG: DUF447 domain-containing protein [Planctomycetota bacterium]
MILEGIVTTLDATRSPSHAPGAPPVNVSPMGPFVSEDMRQLTLRPYQSSRTYRNLKQCGEGVFHVTDDALLLAKTAVGTVSPEVTAASEIRGSYLVEACRAYEFRVRELDDSSERTRIIADVVHVHRLRNFFGWNRAKHAVLEAAILATRIAFLPADDIAQQFGALEPLVEKTAGPREREAFEFLRDYVRAASQTESKGER